MKRLVETTGFTPSSTPSWISHVPASSSRSVWSEVPVAVAPLAPAQTTGPDTRVNVLADGPFLAQVQEMGPPSASVTVAAVTSGTFRDWYVDTGTSSGMSISGGVLTA